MVPSRNRSPNNSNKAWPSKTQVRDVGRLLQNLNLTRHRWGNTFGRTALQRLRGCGLGFRALAVYGLGFIAQGNYLYSWMLLIVALSSAKPQTQNPSQNPKP